ncbi:HAD family hydrolase [Streptomyces sp. NPDC002766]|uniref:HAD family hydrolase n=1 Tax=Streptomyces sp. NPDC002766 TaxID=3154429 RepID=UPI003329CE20
MRVVGWRDGARDPGRAARRSRSAAAPSRTEHRLRRGRAGPSTTASSEHLRDLIPQVRYVLWDLDGPICRLFAKHSAPDIAKRMIPLIDKLAQEGRLEVPVPPKRLRRDPHERLRAVGQSWGGAEQVARLEEWLTGEELTAVDSARGPGHQTLGELGVRFAVSTNNAGRAATCYPAATGLGKFFPHVFGRTSELSLMKPDPRTLLLALDALGAAPAQALMLGDAPTDFKAAQAAGVAFLGYADKPNKVRKLLEAGCRRLAGINALLRPHFSGLGWPHSAESGAVGTA